MIAGLPWTTWLLLLGSFGAGLAVTLAGWMRHRREGARGTGAAPGAGADTRTSAEL